MINHCAKNKTKQKHFFLVLSLKIPSRFLLLSLLLMQMKKNRVLTPTSWGCYMIYSYLWAEKLNEALLTNSCVVLGNLLHLFEATVPIMTHNNSNWYTVCNYCFVVSLYATFSINVLFNPPRNTQRTSERTNTFYKTIQLINKETDTKTMYLAHRAMF